ncbi:MAG: iron-sulfur cluster assembly protein, partial [Hyphomicrobium sp.]
MMDGKPLEKDRPTEAAPSNDEKAGEPAAGAKPTLEECERLHDDIVAALKTVYDPEIPSDVYELGLIYDIAIDAERGVTITM